MCCPGGVYCRVVSCVDTSATRAPVHRPLMSTGRQHAAEDVELAPVTAACDPVDDRNLTAATMQTTLSTSVESGWTVKVSAQPLNFKAAHRPANSWANAA